MKRSITLAVAMIFASGAALAGHCPLEMKSIDEALAKKPKLTEVQMKDVKKFRADGEAHHKAGKHAESLESLTKAQKILGVKPAKS